MIELAGSEQKDVVVARKISRRRPKLKFENGPRYPRNTWDTPENWKIGSHPCGGQICLRHSLFAPRCGGKEGPSTIILLSGTMASWISFFRGIKPNSSWES